MLETLRSLWQLRFVRLVIYLLFAFGTYLFLQRTREVWLIFLTAMLIAYLFQPLVRWSERRRVRWLGMVLFFVALLLLLGFVSALLTGLVRQLGNLSTDLPDFVNRAGATWQTLPLWLQSLPLPKVVTDALSQGYSSLGQSLQPLLARFLTDVQTFLTGGKVVGFVQTVVGDIIRVIALITLSSYLVLDLPRITQSLLNAFPKPYQSVARDLANKLERSVGAYFRGQLLVALLGGLIVWLGLSLLRLPLALSIGFLAGMFNLVPFLGVIIAIIPALLLALTEGWGAVLGVIVIFTLANQLESHVFSPLILGRSMELHPVTVVIALLTGAILFGVLGAVFAVPLVAFFKLVYQDYYLNSHFYENG